MDQRRCLLRSVVAGCCVALSLAAWLCGAPVASAATQTWDTPAFGGYQWVVPAGITSVAFDLSGASGGPAGGSIGGHGGETRATIAVTPGESLNVNVGGAGAAPGGGGGLGGGGGNGSPVCAAGGFACFGAVGGGASDVRQGGTALTNRVLVAGGGGGAGGPSSDFCNSDTPPACQTSVGGGDGGDGGALSGGRGADGANYVVLNPPPGQLPGGGCGGGGGTQAAGGSATGDGNTTCHGPTGNTSGGSEGLGGRGGDTAQGAGSGGGGGGGYFGGGGGSGGASTSSGDPKGGNNGGGGGGGGGGSGYAAPSATNVSIAGGKNLGDGSVTVTYGHTHVLTVSDSGQGSVASSPAGIHCGATCSHSYDDGTAVLLTATPAAGSSFAGWAGACSGHGACHVSMSADRSVSATFKPKPSCTLKPLGSRVFGRALTGAASTRQRKRRKGVLKLTARCNQAAQLKLAGKITAFRRARNGKKRPKPQTFPLAAVRTSTKANEAHRLTMKLPRAARSALKAGARESAAFTLVARNANGTSAATAKIASLKLRKK